MPNLNVPGSQPYNTLGQGRQVGPNVPFYWGHQQYYVDGAYTTPVFQPGEPLHIPRVCRFIYGYTPEQTPPETEWTGCGCPEGGDCPGKVCEWVLISKEVLGFGLRFIPGTPYEVGGDISPSVPTTNPKNYYFMSYVAANNNIVVFADNTFTTIIFSGDARTVPESILKKAYLYRVRWQRNCYVKNEDGSPDYSQPIEDDDCGSNYEVTYAHKDYNPGLVCEQTGWLTNDLVEGFFVPFWQANDSNVQVTVTDYPTYGQYCVPGVGPCGEP